MSDQVGPKLSAALQAQASGLGMGSLGMGSLGTESPAEPVPAPPAQPPTPAQTQVRPRMPGWAVLMLAMVLGAMAGGLAGVISTW